MPFACCKDAPLIYISGLALFLHKSCILILFPVSQFYQDMKNLSGYEKVQKLNKPD
jgi:hypothetical protein